MIKKLNGDDILEVLQLLNGDIFIYHGGFKEEAFMEDIFKFIPGESNLFTRFNGNLAKPFRSGTVRLNRAAIVFAWYIDPDSDTVQKLKKIIAEQKG